MFAHGCCDIVQHRSWPILSAHGVETDRRRQRPWLYHSSITPFIKSTAKRFVTVFSVACMHVCIEPDVLACSCQSRSRDTSVPAMLLCCHNDGKSDMMPLPARRSLAWHGMT